ncbi:MAG: hypothetical protein E7353_05830 [Clostridiales bacterium]|nr:hypothetical protein [Clostridiales bacterium]
MDFILKEAKALEGELIELRRSLHKIPSVYFFLHTNNGEDVCYSNHNPKFDVDESVLIKGVASYLAIVFSYLK